MTVAVTRRGELIKLFTLSPRSQSARFGLAAECQSWPLIGHPEVWEELAHNGHKSPVTVTIRADWEISCYLHTVMIVLSMVMTM